MHNKTHLHKLSSGFTLIEVMVVIAILGIISAIAYPNYTEYVRRSYRSEAQTGLLQAAQWMERAATATGTYPLTAKFPDNLKSVPADRYNISLVSNGSTYTLTATAKGSQSSDKCGDFTLTHHGTRGNSKGTTSDCWK